VVVIASLLSALVLSTGGCTTALFTVAYLIKGTNVPPECEILKGKKVAVVCRSRVDVGYTHARVDHELAEQVGYHLKQNISKIKVVEHRKVAQWMDEKQWEEFDEVGKAMEADYAVGIDLEGFRLLDGQTLYRGRACVDIEVVDCKTGQSVFKKHLPDTPYPPNRDIPASEKSPQDFRQEFIRVLADRIGRYFYEHDPHADLAQDAKSMD
jgi:hypothetical protein